MAKLSVWGQLVSKVGLGQVAVQSVGFASGILIVRLLPSAEYAHYTLALAMLGTMSVLADCGITSAVMAQGGQVWQNREQLGTVIATGLALRRRFAIISITISVPTLIFLLRSHGASWNAALLLTIAILFVFLPTLSASLLEVAPKLHQRVGPLQTIAVSGNLGRLILLGATLKALPFSITAICASGAMQLWTNTRLTRLSDRDADLAQAENTNLRKNMLLVVHRMLPTGIYYCLSAQLTVWLISLFGSTHALAQLGGLSRINQALVVASVILSTLFVPRFARAPSVRHSLLPPIVISISVAIAMGTAACITVIIVPTFFLGLLGDGYKGLETELLLGVAGASLAMVSGLVNALSSSRGWITPPTLLITVAIVSKTLLIWILDVTTLRGVLLLSVFDPVTFIILRLCYLVHRVNKITLA